MDNMLPVDPRARRLALIIWAVGAVLGTVAVWWLSSYLDSLTELARTDRAASLALFRSRVLPAFVAVVLIGVVAGAFLMRQGLQIVRARKFPLEGTMLLAPTRHKAGGAARLIGLFLAFVGFLMAAVPLVVLTVVLWLLQRA